MDLEQSRNRYRSMTYDELANSAIKLFLIIERGKEVGVSFIIYWDGKKLRGYVPTEGNPYNTNTMRAFGNDEDADLKNVKKRWPNCPDNIEEWLDADDDAILKDIEARIIHQGSPSRQTVQTIQALWPNLDWTKLNVTDIIRAWVVIFRELAKATGTTLDDQAAELIGLLVAQRYGLPVPAMAVEPVFVVTAHLDELPADVKARVVTSPILAALLVKVGPLFLKLLLSQLPL